MSYVLCQHISSHVLFHIAVFVVLLVIKILMSLLLTGLSGSGMETPDQAAQMLRQSWLLSSSWKSLSAILDSTRRAFIYLRALSGCYRVISSALSQ